MTNPYDDLRRYAEDLAADVSPYTAQRAVRSALAADVRRPRKALIVLVTTGLLGISNVALAAVADPAVPGDPLYGVDRAYEQVVDLVGLGGPRVGERMVETGVLVERGHLAEALALVQETLNRILESDDPQAALAELEESANGQPADVAALVALARDTSRSGQQVSDLARDLRDIMSNRPDDAGPSEDSPSNTAPGQGNHGQGNHGQGNQGQGNQGQGNQGQGPSDETPANPNAGGNQP